jgi:hypothetical protein
MAMLRIGRFAIELMGLSGEGGAQAGVWGRARYHKAG